MVTSFAEVSDIHSMIFRLASASVMSSGSMLGDRGRLWLEPSGNPTTSTRELSMADGASNGIVSTELTMPAELSWVWWPRIIGDWGASSAFVGSCLTSVSMASTLCVLWRLGLSAFSSHGGGGLKASSLEFVFGGIQAFSLGTWSPVICTRHFVRSLR